MAKPPYGRIAGVAKHGSDEELLALRDEIRWLGRWADDIHGELQSIWKDSEVVISPEQYDKDCDMEVRNVVIRLKLTTSEINTLTTLLKESDE